MRQSFGYAYFEDVLSKYFKFANFCRLEPTDQPQNITEGIQARVKDPLWFLGRQWAMGEFRARDGGSPIRSELAISSLPLDGLQHSESPPGEASAEPVDLRKPLEAQVEHEVLRTSGIVRPRSWQPARLAYSFRLYHGETLLKASHYDGKRLDWYTFDVEQVDLSVGSKHYIALKPAPLTFPGAPLPRWWSFEDRRVDLGDIRRSDQNPVAMLLMEFVLLYANDWLIIPVQQQVGHLRRLDTLRIIDSFGIVTDVKPVIDPTSDQSGSEVFTLSNATGGRADGRLLFLPHTLHQALESEPFESVSFFRDEGANVVWATERSYRDETDTFHNRDDEESVNAPPPLERVHYWDVEATALVPSGDVAGEGEPGFRYLGAVEVYEGKSYVPAHWIPCLPRQLGVDGQIALRRGRTEEDISRLPQYKGKLLSETVWVNEEVIPRSGVLLHRMAQLARTTEGNPHLWIGRKISVDIRRKASGLRFDTLR